MKPRNSRHLSILGALVFTANAGYSAPVTQTADDGIGTASFVDSARWSNSLVPAAGNTYSTNGFIFRTPTASTATLTFAGDSLSVNTKASPNVGATVITKGGGTQTISFPSLIMNGGVFSQGQANVTHTVAGAITSNVTSGFSITDSSDRNLFISAPISGAGRLHVGSFNSYNSAGYTPTAYTSTFAVSGNNSSFSGGWTLGGGYDATFFGGSTTYRVNFNASGITFRLGHINALGTGTLELNAGVLNLNGYSPSGLAGVTFPTGSTAILRTAANTLTSTNLNFGTTTGSAAVIDLLSTGTPATAPLNSTTLTVNGPSTLSIKGLTYAVGSFPLISYSGTIGGPLGFSDLSLVLPSGVSGALTNTPGSLISANITAIEAIRWTNGAASGAWNTSALNWKNSANADVAYQENAVGGYSVLFNESEPEVSPVAITIPATVSPNTVAINNPAKNYTFSGSAINCSGNFTKDGAGIATFGGTVTVGGSASINTGRVEFTGSGTLTNGPLNIASGAFLSYNSASTLTHAATSSAGMTLTGAGTIEKKGAGTVIFANSTGLVRWNLGAGALIDVQGGKLVGGSNDKDIWTNNKASLNIASGATFDGVEANITVDALTGSGIYQGGFYGPRWLNIGVNGGSGTFSGTLQGNGTGYEGSPTLAKWGNGDQVLNGTLNIHGWYGQDTLQVRGGTGADPSVLTISPTGTSVIGVNNHSIYFSPGVNDVTEVNQTAGTLIASTFGVGESSQCTYNFSGGIVNAGLLSVGYSGGSGNNGPAVMNISGTAQLNVNSNGDIRLGVYYGRQVTINQTGGEVIQYSDTGVTRGGNGRLNFAGSNQNLTWNLKNGTLSLAGMAWQPSGGGGGGGNGVLNLNGGILQITNSAFAVPTGLATNGQPKVAAKVLGDETTPNSGAIIDNYGLNVTFAAPILHGPTGPFDGGLKLATSIPGGSLTLSGINTYTGNTTVLAGNTLNLADNAGLTFVLDGTVSNKITGAGSVTINGDFTIDTTYAGLANGNTWTLVDAPISPGTFTSSFTIVGFNELVSGVHTKVDGANTWTFNEGTGVLSLSVSAGYGSWISKPEFGLALADQDPTDDPDNDGMENLLEFVLNGNPSTSDPSILPNLVLTANDYEFTFARRDDSISPETTQTFQYGTDLTGWSSIIVPASAGSVLPATISVVDGTPADTVTVKIPKSLAGPGGKLFGRLMVTKP